MSIMIILLGCNLIHILNDRVNSAITFANFYNSNVNYYDLYDYKITWFLTGGVKNKNHNALTEADTMKNILKTKNIHEYNWNYIIDDESTNTAQNFIAVNQMTNDYDFEKIYVVTSEFHHERANKISKLVNENNTYSWILSPIEDRDSRYWEKIHIKNIENDVISARRHLNV